MAEEFVPQLSPEAQRLAKRTLELPAEHLPTSIGSTGVGLLHPEKAAAALAVTSGVYLPKSVLKAVGKTAVSMSDKSAADALLKMVPEGPMRNWFLTLDPETRNRVAATVLARMATQKSYEDYLKAYDEAPDAETKRKLGQQYESSLK